MELDLFRINGGKDDTIGLLFVDRKFACFILEDEARGVKVKGETRIPSGRYPLKLRDRDSGMHQRYLANYGPSFHKGMLEICNIPNFNDVYLHIGNKESQTDGCPLTGDTCQQNVTGKGFVGQSTEAYKRIYPVIAGALVDGKDVFITVHDEGELPFYTPETKRRRGQGRTL